MRICKRPGCGKSLEGRYPNVIWCSRSCYQTEFEISNPEHKKRKDERYRQKNREKHKAACKKWREENPQENAEIKKKWRKDNAKRHQGHVRKSRANMSEERRKTWLEKQRIYTRKSDRKRRGFTLISNIMAIKEKVDNT